MMTIIFKDENSHTSKQPKCFKSIGLLHSLKVTIEKWLNIENI